MYRYIARVSERLKRGSGAAVVREAAEEEEDEEGEKMGSPHVLTYAAGGEIRKLFPSHFALLCLSYTHTHTHTLSLTHAILVSFTCSCSP